MNTNDFFAQICGLPTEAWRESLAVPLTEAELLAADLAANAAKADWHKRNDLAAFCCQIQDKGEAA